MPSFVSFIAASWFLELSVLRCAREWNDVTDVLHTSDEEDESLEAKSKTCVWAATPTTCVEVPPEVGHVHFAAIDL